MQRPANTPRPDAAAQAKRRQQARRDKAAQRRADLQVAQRHAYRRNAAMIEDRLAGMSKQELAGKYNVSPEVVSHVIAGCEAFPG